MDKKKLSVLAVMGFISGCNPPSDFTVNINIQQHSDIRLITHREFSEKEIYPNSSNPINEEKVIYPIEYNNLISYGYIPIKGLDEQGQEENYEKHLEVFRSNGGKVPADQPYILEIPIISDTEFISIPKINFKGELNIYRCTNLYGYPSTKFNPETVSNSDPELLDDGTVKYSLFIAMNDIAANYMFSGLDDLCISADASETVTVNGNWVDNFSSDPNNYRRYEVKSNEIVIPKNIMAELLDYWSVPYD